MIVPASVRDCACLLLLFLETIYGALFVELHAENIAMQYPLLFSNAANS